MYSHNKGNFFCSSPFTHPFYCCLWNSFQESSGMEISILLLPGIPACCCMLPPKCYAPFSLNTNWKCLAPRKKKSKHTFFRLQLFFSPVCTVRLYRQCDLQAMRTLWSVQQTGVGRLAAAGKAAPLPDLDTSPLHLMAITHSSKASRCTKAKLPQSPVQHPHSQGWKLPKISLNENHSLMAMQSVRPYTTCCNY